MTCLVERDRRQHDRHRLEVLEICAINRQQEDEVRAAVSRERLPVAVEAGRQARFDPRNRGAIAGHQRLLVFEGLGGHRGPCLLVRHELHAGKRRAILLVPEDVIVVPMRRDDESHRQRRQLANLGDRRAGRRRRVMRIDDAHAIVANDDQGIRLNGIPDHLRVDRAVHAVRQFGHLHRLQLRPGRGGGERQRCDEGGADHRRDG